MLLNNAQKIRLMEAAMLDTFILPKSHAFTVAMQQEQETFAKRVDEYREKRKTQGDLAPLGPPHPLIFGALLEVASKTAAVGGQSQENINQLKDDFNACEKIEDAEQLARVCRLATTAKEDEVKLIMHLASLGEIRHCLLDGLRQVGARHLRGSAPPGYTEEELQEWAEHLEAQLVRVEIEMSLRICLECG
ncbi:unnamed protein product [Prorocentrum cordatum]|uniref:Uncharacterized protein n=1 Tax=Prorocentrum cordatum TaxID=2364126 RepID=A0ABN9PVK4_9DINO|nr:unnamed protein product [Polarella glacialis]